MTTIPAQLHDETRLNTEQVAALTGISKATLETWRNPKRRGGPPFEKLGPQIIRYKWASLRDWMNTRSVA